MKALFSLVGRAGFEPATNGLKARYALSAKGRFPLCAGRIGRAAGLVLRRLCQKSPTYLILAGAVLILAGCGGGDPEDDPDEQDIEPAPRAAMAAPAVKVMEWGDSTAAGARLSNGSSPSREAGIWLARWGYSFDVRHEAVGGMPAVHLLTGKHPLHLGVKFQRFPSLAWADIGMVRSGINEKRMQTQEEFGATLQDLVNKHRAAGKVAILSTPSPMDPAIIPAATVAYVDASAATVRKVYRANRDVAVLCDQHRYTINHGMVTWKLDGMHPNEAATVWEGRLQAKCILRAAQLLGAR